MGMANVYAMRVNLSVAMVAMVNSSAFSHADISEECKENGPSNSSLTYSKLKVVTTKYYKLILKIVL